jgi:ABC-type multidrug transport system fused ATPase/permease subunit
MKSKQEKKRYSSLRAYIKFIATFKGRFFAVFGLFTASDIMLAVLPVFIGEFVAAISAHTLDRGHIYWIVGILIAISVGHDLVWRSAELLYRRWINAKGYEFENIVFQAVMSRPYPYFIDKFTGKISSYVSTVGREFRDFINEVCYEYADLVVKLPIISAIMFTVNIPTGVVFVVSIAIMFIAGRKLVERTVTTEREQTSIAANLDGYAIDVISNFVSVKAFRRERAEFSAVTKKRGEVIRAANRAFFWSIIFWGSMSVVVRWVIWPVTILLNVYFFLHGQLSVAQMTTFISTLLIFSDYIWMVIWNVSQFNLKLGRIEEAYTYLFGSRNVVTEHLKGAHELGQRTAPEFAKSLTFKGLDFAYPDKSDRRVLDAIDLTIKKNEKVGIVGTSGSGKTTLIKLLLGYYEVPKAMMELDGRAIDNRQLVDLIAYVPQDTPLFHRTIRENIAYGSDTEVTQEEIETAARRAHAHEFITQTADGYDALVGERGIKLSMGQRQRVAIARAFLDDKPLLILDEATSALDSESEVLVQEALENLWHDRTVIAIAHRLSTLRHMDRIVVMDKGRIIEQGTHEQLLKEKGRYYRLWQHQSGGVLSEEDDPS